ncbi:MAG: NB-ARC domain-containing protein [Chloroflexota bacterium]
MQPRTLTDLPANAPIRFGQAIRQISADIFCPDRPRKASQHLCDAMIGAYDEILAHGPPTLAIRLQELQSVTKSKERSLRLSPRTVGGWFNGDLRQARGPFREKHFLILAYIFWKNNALTSADQIRDLARSAGEDFVRESYGNWLIELASGSAERSLSLAQGKPTYPVPVYMVERSDWKREVNERITQCVAHRAHLVLYGPRGIGKTCFMNCLEKDAWMQRKFPDGILRASLDRDTLGAHLQSWFQKVCNIYPNVFQSENETANKIKSGLKDKRCLLLLDDVTDLEVANALIALASERCFVIVSTYQERVANFFSKADFVVRLQGFSSEQGFEYARHFFAEQDFQEAFVQELNQLLGGNPLGFDLALRTVDFYGWDNLLERLRQPSTATIQDMESNVLLPIHLAYESLPSHLQASFRSLGALPWLNCYNLDIIQAVFNIPAADTQARLNSLVITHLLQPVESASEPGWKIHQLVYVFAQFELAQFPQEHLAAEKWKERLKQSENWKKFCDEVNTFSRKHTKEIWQYNLKRFKALHRKDKPPQGVEESHAFTFYTLLTSQLSIINAFEWLFIYELEQVKAIEWRIKFLQLLMLVDIAVSSLVGFFVQSHGLDKMWLLWPISLLALSAGMWFFFFLTDFIIPFYSSGSQFVTLHCWIAERFRREQGEKQTDERLAP